MKTGEDDCILFMSCTTPVFQIGITQGLEAPELSSQLVFNNVTITLYFYNCRTGYMTTVN